jgi:hypothetical protein
MSDQRVWVDNLKYCISCMPTLSDDDILLGKDVGAYLERHGLATSSLDDDDFISTLKGLQREETINKILEL